MEKRARAKAEMLKELSREMSDDMYSPMKDMIGKKGMKGMKKVSVMSDSPEGLEKGLSMAEKLMKLKSKQNGEEDSMDEEDSEEMEMSPSDKAMEEVSEMSDEEKMAMFELLKKELSR